PRDADGVMGIAGFLNASNQALTPVVKEKLAPSAKKDVKGEATTWKDIVIRSKDFPEELNIVGSNFVRVDHLQLVNDESEKAHKFRIEGQKDMWKSRQTFTYPDKEPVSDSGVAYIGGEAKWQVQNLKPGKDLIIIKRFDAILGEQICDISVDGKKVGKSKVTEADRKHRWRNHYVLEMQQAMMAGGGGVSAIPMPAAGQGTAMLNVQEIGGEKGRGSQDKSREVCGWIVALNGQHKGEDFRLRVGKNVLGTAADCD